MDIWHLVGRNVAARRRAHGWSQEAFADRCGFSQQYLSGLEKGRRNPTLKTMFELATALGIAMVDLFAEPLSEVGQQPRIKRLERKA